MPSDIHPLAHPPWTNLACVVPPPSLAVCLWGGAGCWGSPRSPQRGWPGHGGSDRGFPISWEWFPRNSLHDGPITLWRLIDLLLLVLRRPPPAWCLLGWWLTQPGT